MTTLVDSTMTLSNARYSNDDQQVPDSNSVVVPVKTERVSGKTTKPLLPDFTTILLDQPAGNASNTITALNTPDLLQSLDFSYQDQLDTAAGSFVWEEDAGSLYDGFSLDADKKPQMAPVVTPDLATLQPVRPNTLPLAPSQALPLTTTTTPTTSEYGAISPPLSCSSEESTVFLPVELEKAEELEEECEDICRQLWIPRNPYHWSEEHVQKWVDFLRVKYNIPKSEDLLRGVLGMELCRFSEQDFQARCGQAGQCLGAELEWFKAASGSPMEVPSPVTYTDLSSPASTTCYSATAPQVSASNPNMYTTAAPLPLTSPLTSPLASSPSMLPSEIPTPVLANTELTKSLYQINNEVDQQQQQRQQQQQQQQLPYSYLSAMTQWDDGTTTTTTNTPMTSCDSSLNSVDFSMIKQEVKMEDEEMESEDEDEMGASGAEKRRYVSHSKHTIHLWQFLKNLLQSPDHYCSHIKWLDERKGIFKIENSREVAKLWGQRKNRPAMNYDKLSRSIRQYYKKGIIKKTEHSKRLVYQFQPAYL